MSIEQLNATAALIRSRAENYRPPTPNELDEIAALITGTFEPRWRIALNVEWIRNSASNGGAQ